MLRNVPVYLIEIIYIYKYFCEHKSKQKINHVLLMPKYNHFLFNIKKW